MSTSPVSRRTLERFLRKVLRDLMEEVQVTHAKRLKQGKDRLGRFTKPLNNLYRNMKKAKGQPLRPGIATGDLYREVLSVHNIRFPAGTKFVVDWEVVKSKKNKIKAWTLHHGKLQTIGHPKQSWALRFALLPVVPPPQHTTARPPFKVGKVLHQPPRKWIGLNQALKRRIHKKYLKEFAPWVSVYAGRRLKETITRALGGNDGVIRIRIA